MSFYAYVFIIWSEILCSSFCNCRWQRNVSTIFCFVLLAFNYLHIFFVLFFSLSFYHSDFLSMVNISFDVKYGSWLWLWPRNRERSFLFSLSLSLSLSLSHTHTPNLFKPFSASDYFIFHLFSVFLWSHYNLVQISQIVYCQKIFVIFL